MKSAMMTTIEVAHFLHVSSQTVKKMAEEGILPPMRTSNKKGAHYRFRRSDVMKLAGFSEEETHG